MGSLLVTQTIAPNRHSIGRRRLHCARLLDRKTLADSHRVYRNHGQREDALIDGPYHVLDGRSVSGAVGTTLAGVSKGRGDAMIPTRPMSLTTLLQWIRELGCPGTLIVHRDVFEEIRPLFRHESIMWDDNKPSLLVMNNYTITVITIPNEQRSVRDAVVIDVSKDLS